MLDKENLCHSHNNAVRRFFRADTEEPFASMRGLPHVLAFLFALFCSCSAMLSLKITLFISS
jgi:hypothetical protein